MPIICRILRYDFPLPPPSKAGHISHVYRIAPAFVIEVGNDRIEIFRL